MWTCRVVLIFYLWQIYCLFNKWIQFYFQIGSGNDGDLLDWYPSQVKGPVDDEVQEGKENRFDYLYCWWYIYFLADLISTIEFNEDGELLAVGDKGGRIVVFQREQQVIKSFLGIFSFHFQ